MMNRTHTSSFRFLSVAMSLLAIGLLLPTVVGAQATGINGFTRIGDYLVEVDGSDVESAEIYGAQQARALLILGGDFTEPILIGLANGSVAGVNLMKVARQANGSVNLLPNPLSSPYGNFTVEGDQVVFEVEGRRLRPQLRVQAGHLHAGRRSDQRAASAVRRSSRAYLLRHVVPLLRRDGAAGAQDRAGPGRFQRPLRVLRPATPDHR